jgi:hypothetical protein
MLGEARSEGMEGMTGVGNTVINRVLAGGYADTISGVVTQKAAGGRHQFSYIDDNNYAVKSVFVDAEPRPPFTFAVVAPAPAPAYLKPLRQLQNFRLPDGKNLRGYGAVKSGSAEPGPLRDLPARKGSQLRSRLDVLPLRPQRHRSEVPSVSGPSRHQMRRIPG